MINLIKNELTKIFHKKGLYIFGAILLILMFFNLFISLRYGDQLVDRLDSFYYESLEEGLDSYDLSNPEDASWYVQDKTDLETYQLLKEYAYESPEYYYIDTIGNPLIETMYHAKYIEKDDEKYNQAKEEYEAFLSSLNNYDWRHLVLSEQEKVKEQISALEGSISSDSEEAESVKKEIEALQYQVEGYQFRLDRDIAPAYTKESALVETYVSSATEYASLSKDESYYKDRNALLSKRETEENYYVSKYKLENEFVIKESSLQDNFTSSFLGIDIFVLIAIFIVAGGIVSEEFNKGTIKQLLVRPHSRAKILLSKMIAAVIAVLLFSVFYYLADFVVEAIECGEMQSLWQPMVVYDFHKSAIVEYSTISYCFIHWLAVLPVYAIIFMFVLFMGAFTLNTAGTIVAGFALYFLSDLVDVLAPQKITAFLPTSCWNFTEYLFGGVSSNPYASLGLSVVVCVLTFAVLTAAAFLCFQRRDIKNQ